MMQIPVIFSVCFPKKCLLHAGITLVENNLKILHLNFSVWAFPTNFCPIKSDLAGNTVCPQALGFQKLAKFNIFGVFSELFSTQNVYVARFARIVE